MLVSPVCSEQRELGSRAGPIVTVLHHPIQSTIDRRKLDEVPRPCNASGQVKMIS